jgi:hypothetical protein
LERLFELEAEKEFEQYLSDNDLHSSAEPSRANSTRSSASDSEEAISDNDVHSSAESSRTSSTRSSASDGEEASPFVSSKSHLLPTKGKVQLLQEKSHARSNPTSSPMGRHR